MRPFTVLSNLIHLFQAQTTWHISKTESHQHLKTLNMCALLQSPVHMKIINNLRTFNKITANHFVGFQIDFEGY